IRTDLAWAVVADRHSGPRARSDGVRLVAEIAARHGSPLRLQLRNRRGDDRGIDVLEVETAQGEQVAQGSAELVGRGLAHRGKAPVLVQRLVLEGAEMSLGVADVDRKEHRPGIMLRRAMAYARPRLYVLPGSHPCAAVEAALRLKSISYNRVT